MVNVLVVKGHQALVTYYGHLQRAQRIIAYIQWSMRAGAATPSHLAPRTTHRASRTRQRTLGIANHCSH